MTTRPNILLVMTDQHRVDTLGSYGAPVCRTPVLDGLAAAGSRFTNAFTVSAICTPTRASLLTGVAPYRHKLLANFERNVGYQEELGGEFPPYTEILAGAGYRRFHVGKWHVGKLHGPEDFGFEGEHFPGWGNAVDHPAYLKYLEQNGYPPYRLTSEVRGEFPNGEPGNLLAGILDQPTEATFEYFLAEQAISRIREAELGDEPFFLGLHFFGPHLPYCLPAEHYQRYDRSLVELPVSMMESFEAKPLVQRHYSGHWSVDGLGPDTWRDLIAAYWGYVSLIDSQIGRVFEALHECGFADDTAILFSADHGEFTGSHRLHDKGPAMYDDIYRVPLLMRIPGAPAGRVDERFAGTTDLTATIADLAGAPVPSHYDGRSLAAGVRGEPEEGWREDIVAEFHGHHFPYPQRMIRTEQVKLVINPPDVNELYDLQADPHELVNRYDDPEYRQIRDELMLRLYTLLRERGDNFYHWMTSMFDVGGKTYDAALSALDKDANR